MNELTVIERNGQRVLTTAQLAESYGTDSKIISKNFERNKERYKEGKHYYCLTGEDLKAFFANDKLSLANVNLTNANKIRTLYLWTERGTLLHAKSLNTNKAWEVYDYLVEHYFRTMPILDSYMIEDPEERVARWLEEYRERKALKATVAEQTKQIEEMQPKVSYYTVILNSPNLISTTVIAKDYGRSATWLNKYLHVKGIQYKQGTTWVLYSKYQSEGYTGTKTHIYTKSDGSTDSNVATYWTQKGRKFIYELLKADGILPLIERD